MDVFRGKFAKCERSDNLISYNTISKISYFCLNYMHMNVETPKIINSFIFTEFIYFQRVAL